jgi:hypothetical protein
MTYAKKIDHFSIRSSLMSGSSHLNSCREEIVCFLWFDKVSPERLADPGGMLFQAVLVKQVMYR